DATFEQYIAAAIGLEAVVGGTQLVTGPELLGEVERCLRLEGDPSCGPFPEVLHSPRCEGLFGVVRGYLEQRIATATTIVSFSLREGHPFYPVIWGFSFLLIGPHGAEVFLGASSD